MIESLTIIRCGRRFVVIDVMLCYVSAGARPAGQNDQQRTRTPASHRPTHSLKSLRTRVVYQTGFELISRQVTLFCSTLIGQYKDSNQNTRR